MSASVETRDPQARAGKALLVRCPRCGESHSYKMRAPAVRYHRLYCDVARYPEPAFVVRDAIMQFRTGRRRHA